MEDGAGHQQRRGPRLAPVRAGRRRRGRSLFHRHRRRGGGRGGGDGRVELSPSETTKEAQEQENGGKRDGEQSGRGPTGAELQFSTPMGKHVCDVCVLSIGLVSQ